MTLRDVILQAFRILPQTSLYVCIRLVQNLKPSQELYTMVKLLVQEGLLIERFRCHRLPPTYELSSFAMAYVCCSKEKFTLTKYKKEVIEKTMASELEFATNQQRALDLCVEYAHKKNIYLSTTVIHSLLMLSSFEDTLSVLTELLKSNELTLIGHGSLWKVNNFDYQYRRKKK